MEYLVEFLRFGVVDLPWWGYLVVALVATHITIAAVTIFLHRAQAHRALMLHPVVSHFFRFWLWLTTGMVTKEWVAIHRKHHAKCETPEDPHSPTVYGLNRVLWLGVLLYVRASHDKEILVRYGTGTPDDWIERNLYSRFPKVGVATLFLVQCALFGFLSGPLVWLVQMAWIPFWAAGVINGVGHALGYRNSDTPDASTNIVPWGIVIGGEELHNNHHAYPASAKFAIKPYELDLGWKYIRILSWFGLAKVKAHQLPPKLEPSRDFINQETIAFLRSDRGYVRNHYRKLLLRVVKHELQGASGDTRERLLTIRKKLRGARWDNDVITECVPTIASLEGTASKLPHLGKFACILSKIQKPHHEERTTPEREATLVSELDRWARETIALSTPKVEAFARVLMQTTSAKTVS